MLRSLDLGRNFKSEFAVYKIGKKGHFFAKNDIFLTKKRAKNAAFCYGSASRNKLYVVDLMCVIRNFIGKNALSQPQGGVGMQLFHTKQPQRSKPIRLQGSRQANKDLQSAGLDLAG
jgi:hypothetical protein